MNKAALLEQIRADILTNNVCPDLAREATNLVMGDGNPNATIVFIGEAPGKNEDLQGKPFIGAAGTFLNELLEVAGLDRTDVYITNIVKYRPPNNRDPLPLEKQAFWPYLVRQLEIIKPEIAVTLGRHSMEYFLPGTKISHAHAQSKKVAFGDATLVIIPMYHPAAALYSGAVRQTLINDFRMLPKIIESLEKEKEK